MSVTVYVSTISGSQEIKKQQQKILMILDSKKIAYKEVDIASDEDDKKKMREIAGEKSLPPQICNGDNYCGDYTDFDNAVEAEAIEEFLKLK